MAKLREQLKTTGQVTALGQAFEDLALRHSTNQLAVSLLSVILVRTQAFHPLVARLARETNWSPDLHDRCWTFIDG